jgi:transposase
MAGRRKSVLDIREMIRRLRMGEGDRAIARDMELSRNTVKKYRKWAQEHGFLQKAELPELGVLEQRHRATMLGPAPGPESLCEPYRAFITEKLLQGVELRALLALLQERSFQGSYSALKRFVRRLPVHPDEVFVRVETEPAEEAQVDFGYVGELYDRLSGTLRKAWVFVMTLCWSRHQYAQIVFDQRVETWCDLHVRAFEFFGGVTTRVRIDNLKAAITRAVCHDPEAQRSYRELAEHYDFLISPCKKKTPRHKGKVESGVRYVKRNALAGRTFADREEANAHLLRWIFQTAGVRDHGTTHEAPLVRFERERPLLKKLPAERFEVVTWKQVKLHPDCHVVFDYSFYSAPFRLARQTLWLRATAQRVELYFEHERIASHPRAASAGQRITQQDHLPPQKIQGLLASPQYVRRQAAEIGPQTAEFVERLLGQRPLDRLRAAQGIVALAQRVGTKRLEAACQRALVYEDIRFQTIKTILNRGLDLQLAQTASAAGPLPKTSTFARPIAEQVPGRLF